MRNCLDTSKGLDLLCYPLFMQGPCPWGACLGSTDSFSHLILNQNVNKIGSISY